MGQLAVVHCNSAEPCLFRFWCKFQAQLSKEISPTKVLFAKNCLVLEASGICSNVCKYIRSCFSGVGFFLKCVPNTDAPTQKGKCILLPALKRKAWEDHVGDDRHFAAFHFHHRGQRGPAAVREAQ